MPNHLRFNGCLAVRVPSVQNLQVGSFGGVAWMEYEGRQEPGHSQHDQMHAVCRSLVARCYAGENCHSVMSSSHLITCASAWRRQRRCRACLHACALSLVQQPYRPTDQTQTQLGPDTVHTNSKLHTVCQRMQPWSLHRNECRKIYSVRDAKSLGGDAQSGGDLPFLLSRNASAGCCYFDAHPLMDA